LRKSCFSKVIGSLVQKEKLRQLSRNGRRKALNKDFSPFKDSTAFRLLQESLERRIKFCENYLKDPYSKGYHDACIDILERLNKLN